MSKNLVIVESPAKAKTIEGYLGGDYVVRSSYGHIRDLPGGQLAVDVENGFMPTYEVTADKGRFGELKKLAKSAQVVWLATDEDREEKAISWHLPGAQPAGGQDQAHCLQRDHQKGILRPSRIPARSTCPS